MALEFTDQNFQTEVLASDKLTVVDFWASWCGPCRTLGPVIEELAKDFEGRVQIGKLDVDANPETSASYQITSIPAVLFFKDGKVVDRVVGAQPKPSLAKKIEGLL